MVEKEKVGTNYEAIVEKEGVTNNDITWMLTKAKMICSTCRRCYRDQEKFGSYPRTLAADRSHSIPISLRTEAMRDADQVWAACYANGVPGADEIDDFLNRCDKCECEIGMECAEAVLDHAKRMTDAYRDFVRKKKAGNVQ